MMSTLRYAICLLAAVLAGASHSSGAWYAVLVGIEDYQHPDLRTPPLKYAVDDVQELGEVLKGLGYKVAVLSDDTGKDDPHLMPTRANIASALTQAVNKCQQDDTLVIGLAGHGIQFADDKHAYFCPVDARPFAGYSDSLTSLQSVYDQMEASFAGAKIMLVDACRNDPDPTRGRDVLSPDTVPPPRGVGVLFSCSPGQRAFEHDDLKHGIFFYHVIEKLRAGGIQGVNYFDLAGHVGVAVPQRAMALASRQQIPNQQGNVFGAPIIAPPQPAAAEVTNSIGMKLRLIPAGDFVMGSSDAQITALGLHKSYASREQPQHRVAISRDYYLGAHEVTRGQFAEFIRDTGYRTDCENSGEGGPGVFKLTKGKFGGGPASGIELEYLFDWRYTGFAYDDTHPVVNITWDDATAFCTWLSKKEKAYYRLPTEAEWEYACRAGNDRAWSFGNNLEAIVRNGNVADSSYWETFQDSSGFKNDMDVPLNLRDGYAFTAQVGKFAANAYGLHDLHGNVLEWCADWHADNYFLYSRRLDPEGPATGEKRVVRGGSYAFPAKYARSAARAGWPPGKADDALGFRVARTK